MEAILRWERLEQTQYWRAVQVFPLKAKDLADRDDSVMLSNPEKMLLFATTVAFMGSAERTQALVQQHPGIYRAARAAWHASRMHKIEVPSSEATTVPIGSNRETRNRIYDAICTAEVMSAIVDCDLSAFNLGAFEQKNQTLVSPKFTTSG